MITIGLLFWLLMLLMLFFGFWAYWPIAPEVRRPFGGHFIFWFLLFLLGWATFGFPISGK